MPDRDSPTAEYTIQYQYPHPIAYSFRRMKVLAEPPRRLASLLTTAETTLRFLAAIALADYRSLGCRNEEVESLVRLRTPRTLGNCLGLLRTTSQALRNQSCFVPELFDSFADPGSAVSKALARIISDRNDVAHLAPTRFASSQVAQQTLEELRPFLWVLMQHCYPLHEYVLGWLSGEQYDSLTDARKFYLHPCVGHEERTEYRTLHTRSPLPCQEMLLFRPDFSEALVLHPLLRFVHCPQDGNEHLFLLVQSWNSWWSFACEHQWKADKKDPAAELCRRLLDGVPGEGSAWQRLRLPILPHPYHESPASQTLPEFPADTLIDGRYRIVGPLKGGGFGMVHLCQNVRLGIMQALKLMDAGIARNQNNVERFFRSVQLCAQLRGLPEASAHLVLIHDRGTFNGRPYLVMDYIEGGNLQERLGRGPLGAETALHLFLQVLQGLRILHREKIVHRDLKPSNILITTSGDAKITDFDLVRTVDSDITGSTVIGSRGFAAPEQGLAGQGADARSDIFAAGVTLWAMLTGKSPGGYEALRQSLSDLPDSVATIVERCTRWDPNDRYPDVESLLQEAEKCRAEVRPPAPQSPPPAPPAPVPAITPEELGRTLHLVRQESPTGVRPKPVPATVSPTETMARRPAATPPSKPTSTTPAPPPAPARPAPAAPEPATSKPAPRPASAGGSLPAPPSSTPAPPAPTPAPSASRPAPRPAPAASRPPAPPSPAVPRPTPPVASPAPASPQPASTAGPLATTGCGVFTGLFLISAGALACSQLGAVGPSLGWWASGAFAAGALAANLLFALLVGLWSDPDTRNDQTMGGCLSGLVLMMGVPVILWVSPEIISPAAPAAPPFVTAAVLGLTGPALTWWTCHRARRKQPAVPKSSPGAAVWGVLAWLLLLGVGWVWVWAWPSTFSPGGASSVGGSAPLPGAPSVGGVVPGSIRRLEPGVGTPLENLSVQRSGPPLLVSNNPETVTISGDGVCLFRTLVRQPRLRLFMHHEAGAGDPMDLTVSLTNRGQKSLEFYSGSGLAAEPQLGQVGRIPALVGLQVLSRFGSTLLPRPVPDTWIATRKRNEAQTFRVRLLPGEVYTAMAEFAFRPEAGASENPAIEVRVDASPPGGVPRSDLPVAPADAAFPPRVRAVYPTSVRTGSFQCLTDQIRWLDLAGPRDGPVARALDGEYEPPSDGSSAWNLGNYGVTYEIALNLENPGPRPVRLHALECAAGGASATGVLGLLAPGARYFRDPFAVTGTAEPFSVPMSRDLLPAWNSRWLATVEIPARATRPIKLWFSLPGGSPGAHRIFLWPETVPVPAGLARAGSPSPGGAPGSTD